MTEVVFSIGGEAVGEVDLQPGPAGRSIQDVLKQAIGAERMSLLPNLQNVVASSGSVTARADLSSNMDEIERKLGAAQRILVRLNTRLEGGIAPRLTPSAETKMMAMCKVAIAHFRDPNIEFCLLGFGPRDDPSLISEVVLLRGQRVSAASFEADPDALERTMEVIRRMDEPLVLRAVIHKHPGVRSAYHSTRDDNYILPFLRLVAQLLYGLAGWTRVLDANRVVDDAVYIQLDEEGRRSVVLSPREPDGDKARARARALLEEFDISLVGADLRAQLYSLVFSRDGDLYARGVVFESIAATTGDGPPAFAQRVIEEDLRVEVLDAEPLGVAEAQIGTAEEMETEIRRYVRRFGATRNTYAGNLAMLPTSGDDEDSKAGSRHTAGKDLRDDSSPLAKLKVAGQALALAGKALLEATEALGKSESARPVTRGES